MKHQRNKMMVRLLALALIMAIIPSSVGAVTEATVEPRASDYLDSYSAYTYPAGNGLVQVWFDVTGDTYMDDIGSLSIEIYESTNNSTWTWVKTFRHTNYPSMLGHDDYFHSGHVDYQGVAGRYYKAYICIWAGKDGGGDTRYFWTSAKLAT